MRESRTVLKVLKLLTIVAPLTAGAAIASSIPDNGIEAAKLHRKAAPVARKLATSSSSGPTERVSVFDIGTLGTTPWINIDHAGGVLKPGSFLDTYNFTIGSLTHIAANTVSATLGFGGAPLLNITDLKYQLIDSANHTIWDSSFGGASVLGSPLALDGTFASGNYHFQISGIADGSSGGAYIFSVAAVPEPETWMMLLLGLGVAGIMARRRMAA